MFLVGSRRIHSAPALLFHRVWKQVRPEIVGFPIADLRKY